MCIFAECALPSLSPLRPFDPELYEDEGEEDEILDEEGRGRLKLKVTMTTDKIPYLISNIELFSPLDENFSHIMPPWLHACTCT